MRKTPLSREEKEKVGQLLKELNILPPVAGFIGFNLDGQLKVSNFEIQRLVFR